MVRFFTAFSGKIVSPQKASRFEIDLLPVLSGLRDSIKKEIKMKALQWLVFGAVAAICPPAVAEFKEIGGLVPDANEYEIIYKINPLDVAKGYSVNRAKELTGKLTKIGYYLKLTDKDGKVSRVFVAMDPFTDDLSKVGVPTATSGVFQNYVNNLEVYSDSGPVKLGSGVKTGKFKKGNIEFWVTDYGNKNSQNIPGATTAFDFGDQPCKDGNYGSMQVHNYLEEETVFAVNNWLARNNADIGIGNASDWWTVHGGNPDWTFTGSGKFYKDAELCVVGRFAK